MNNPLVDEVKSVLAHAGVTADSRVVIGVSGGPDSLALLHVLKDVILPGRLCVGHLNHRLRKEADEEAAFVARTAESWGIPYQIANKDVAAFAAQQGYSLEEAARYARYDFLDQLASEFEARYIVVAHHADDQVETIFLNILRGAGPGGLRGMKVERPLAPNSKKILVRPFLFTTHDLIAAYCLEFDLHPKLDNSNWDISYRRNYLRHEVLPRIAKVYPQFERHLLQLVDTVRADDDYLAYLTNQAWKEILVEQGLGWLHLDRSRWMNLPLSLRRRTLRNCVQLLRISTRDISFRTIDQAQKVAADGQTGAESYLPGGILLRVVYDTIVVERDPRAMTADLPQLTTNERHKLAIPGKIDLANGWVLTSEIAKHDYALMRQNSDRWRAYVDIGNRQFLEIRPRIESEKFQPLGMDGRSASVQDLMVNYKIPAHLRTRWPIVGVDIHPVWLVGYRVDERAKVNDKSSRVVLLSCRKIRN